MEKRCELYQDRSATILDRYKENTQFNATSGYCHKPDLTGLGDFNPPDPIPKTWYVVKGGGAPPFIRYSGEDKGTILISF